MLSPFLCSVIVLFVTWYIVWYWRKARNLPPGPKGIPILGYYPFLSEQPYKDFAALSKQYGDVLSFRTVGGKLIVILNGIEVIRQVLINRADEFIGRPKESNLLDWISDGLGVTQEEGELWKEHRRFFLQTAKSFGFGKQECEPMIHEEVKTLLKDVKNNDKETCDLRFHVVHAVNSVICQILFSKKFDKYGEVFKEIAKSAKYLVEIFTDNRHMLVGLPYDIYMTWSPSASRIRKAKKLFRQIVQEIVEEHIKTFDPDNLKDYVDRFLHQAYKLEKNGNSNHTFTKERLSSVTFNMIMEGTESVGGTICGLLDVAGLHLEEQMLVQEEIDSVIGTERLPSLADRPKLPYLDAFIQELYRNNLPFSISTQYSNFKETTIEGYHIPERTIIIHNQYAVSNDPVLFPEPWKFNPKRFLDDSGKMTKSHGPYPFGLGKRACIGESLAQMEVFIIIGSILQNFTIYSTKERGKFRVIPRFIP